MSTPETTQVAPAVTPNPQTQPETAIVIVADTIKGKIPPKPPEEFYRDVLQFHERRSTPIAYMPKISGRVVDLHQLYSEVTERGGFLKVNMRDEWDEVLQALGLRDKCVNAGAAMKHIYRRYLEKYERLNYFGEDPDKMEALEAIDPLEIGRSRGRYQHALSGSLSAINTVPMSYNYRQHIVNLDRRRMHKMSTDLHKPSPYEKLMLSLISPLPNEQDFAINVCTLMANESKHTLKLNECPKILELLLAHAGIFCDYTLSKLFQHVYTELRQNSLHSFWRDLLNEKPQILELYSDEQLLRDADLLDEKPDDVALAKCATLMSECSSMDFLNLGTGEGTQGYIGQRVQQIVSILRNLSFFEENVSVLAKNRTFLRFITMSANIRWGNIHTQALDIAGNVAVELELYDPSTDDVSRSLLNTLVEGIQGMDRAVIINSLEILYKLCQNDGNEDHIVKCLNLKFYETLCLFLSLNDIMLLIFSLEAIYALTSLGTRSCHLFMQVRGVVDQLVSLITVEAQSYGPDGCILMRVVETVPGNMLPMVAQNIANLQNAAALQKQHQLPLAQQQQQQQQMHLQLQQQQQQQQQQQHIQLQQHQVQQQQLQPQHHPQPQQQQQLQQPHLPQGVPQQQQQQLMTAAESHHQQPPTTAQSSTPQQQQQQQQQQQHQSNVPMQAGQNPMSMQQTPNQPTQQSQAQLQPHKPQLPTQVQQQAQQQAPPTQQHPMQNQPQQQTQPVQMMQQQSQHGQHPPPQQQHPKQQQQQQHQLQTQQQLHQQKQQPPHHSHQQQHHQQQQQQQLQIPQTYSQEDEQYALAWLGATFERAATVECRVEQQELYRMYLVHCQKSGKTSVVNHMAFPRLVRLIFNNMVGPASVRRADGTDIPGLHYVAIRMRAQPLPIQQKATLQQQQQLAQTPPAKIPIDNKTKSELNSPLRKIKKKVKVSEPPTPQQQQPPTKAESPISTTTTTMTAAGEITMELLKEKPPPGNEIDDKPVQTSIVIEALPRLDDNSKGVPQVMTLAETVASVQQQQQQPSSSLIKSLLANKVTQRQQKQKDLIAVSGTTQTTLHGNVLTVTTTTPQQQHHQHQQQQQQHQHQHSHQQPIKVTSTAISALVNNPLMQNTPVKVGQTTIKPLNPQITFEKKQLIDSTPPPLAPLSGSNVAKDSSGRPVIIANQLLVEMLDKKTMDPPIPATIMKRKMDDGSGSGCETPKRLSISKEEPAVTPSKNAANLYAEMAASILEDEDLDDIPPLPSNEQQQQQQHQQQQQQQTQQLVSTQSSVSAQPQSIIIPTKLQQGPRQLLFQTNAGPQLKLTSAGGTSQQIPTAMATIKTDQGLQTVPVILQQKPMESTQPQIIQQVIQQSAPQTQYVLATNPQGQTYLVAQQTQPPPPPPQPAQTVLVTQTPQQQSTGAKTIIILQQQSLTGPQGQQQQILTTTGGSGGQKMIVASPQMQQVLLAQRPQTTALVATQQSQQQHQQQQPQQIIINAQTGTATHIQHIPVSSMSVSSSGGGTLQRQIFTSPALIATQPQNQQPQAGQISPSLLSQLNHIPATIKLHQPSQQQQQQQQQQPQQHSQATISRLGKTVSIVSATAQATPPPPPPIQIPALQQHQSIIQQHIISGPTEKRQVVLGGRAIEIKETLITQAHPPLQQSQLNSQTIITKQMPQLQVQHQHQHQQQQSQVRTVIDQQQHPSIIQQKITVPVHHTQQQSPATLVAKVVDSSTLVPASMQQSKSVPQAQAVVQTVLPQATVAQTTHTTSTIKRPSLSGTPIKAQLIAHKPAIGPPPLVATTPTVSSVVTTAAAIPIATSTATTITPTAAATSAIATTIAQQNKIETKSVQVSAATSSTVINAKTLATNVASSNAPAATVAPTTSTATTATGAHTASTSTATVATNTNTANAAQIPSTPGQNHMAQQQQQQQPQQQQSHPPMQSSAPGQPQQGSTQTAQQSQISLADANWLYVCDWRNCPRRKFKSLSDLQHHACTVHCPDHLEAAAEIFCQWGVGPGLCDGIPRKRYSLMTHLMDRHITVDSLRAAVQRRLATGALNVQPTQPPVTIVRNVAADAQTQRGSTASPALSTSSSSSLPPMGTSALHAIKRHTADFVNAKELMDENEGPVTKSIRLTAALILRNLVTYTNTAKRSLRRYEPHLANVALSNVESSGALSHILHELSN